MNSFTRSCRSWFNISPRKILTFGRWPNLSCRQGMNDGSISTARTLLAYWTMCHVRAPNPAPTSMTESEGVKSALSTIMRWILSSRSRFWPNFFLRRMLYFFTKSFSFGFGS